MANERNERYDAVIIGAGIGGSTCAHRLSGGGMRVALVEQDRMGGETAYWAFSPSSTLLGPANLLWRMREASGAVSPSVSGAGELSYRDELFELLSDTAQIDRLQRLGISVFRGAATIKEPGRVQVGEQTLDADRIVIATGSQPKIPDIDGLTTAGYWTNREAVSFQSLPQQIVILGGAGTHAIELAQMFRQYSSEAVVVMSANRLVPQEDPAIGELLAQHLHQSAVRVLLGRNARRVEIGQEGIRIVTLDNGSIVQGQRLLIAMARTPRVIGLGLEQTGATITPQGIQVDAYCRAAEGIWAVGDVTGVGPYIHVAHYQARIAADDILGHSHPAFYTSTPRIAFTDPQIAATGLTLAQAREQGIDVASLTVDISGPAGRPRIHTDHPDTERSSVGGKLTMHADRRSGTLVGAWAVAPDAGEWIQLAVLAIRAAVPVVVLHDMLEQFPSFSEVYLRALDQFIL